MTSNLKLAGYVGLGVLALAVIKQLLLKKPSRPLPPGPKPFPLIGNLLDLPTKAQWATFWDWRLRYGNIISLNFFGQRLIVLNDMESMTELLIKKGTTTAGRPVLPMAGELCGLEKTSAFKPHGEETSKTRRFFKLTVGSTRAIQQYAPDIENAAQRLVSNFLDDPDNFPEHVRMYVGQVILKIAYGWNVESTDDKFVRLASKQSSYFSETAKPGRFLVDVVPVLKYVPDWFPGAGFKKFAKEARKTVYRMVDEPYAWCKQQMTAGNADLSFVSSLLNTCESEEDEDLLKWAAFAFYAAGADTSVSQIVATIKALTMYPKTLEAAQEEIDRVIGSDRIPLASDRERLAYADAVVEESLRWHVTLPTGLPHKLTEDEVYRGYFLPKGSVFVPNAKGLSRDPVVYPNPDVFDPTRYLASDGKPGAPSAKHYVFGFGRRACAGQQLADHIIWVAVATLIATFDFKPVVENGLVDVLVDEPLDGAISHQGPFRCSIRPRTEKVAKLIRVWQGEKAKFLWPHLSTNDSF